MNYKKFVYLLSVSTSLMCSQAHAANSSIPIGLEEITVTARRVEENLQKVPISITAFTQADIERLRVMSINDLQNFTPSLSTAGLHRDEISLNIRGLGTSVGGGAVLSYIDEVPLPNATGAFSVGGVGLFYDLQNLQVLKGPQGTLFGRNTTGGALLFQSKRPTDKLEGFLQVGYGNFDNREMQGALNIPVISDKVLARIAVNAQKRDGFTRSLGDPDHPSGKGLDNRNFVAGRASFTLQPSDNFDNTLILGYYNSRTNGTSLILNYVDPVWDTALYPEFSGGAIASGQMSSLLVQQRALGNRRQLPVNVSQHANASLVTVTDVMRYEVADNITVKKTFGYIRYAYDTTEEDDGTSVGLVDQPANLGPQLRSQFTEELQVLGKALDNDLDWIVGGFYLSAPASDIRTAGKVEQTLGFLEQKFNAQSSQSKALYGQINYSLAKYIEGLKLNAGLRYTWDDRAQQGRTLDGSGACVSRPPNADAFCTTSGRASYGALTWSFGLDYQISDDTLLYVAARKGYLAGGANSGAVSAVNQTYQPEYVVDQEIGVKSQWSLANMPVRSNVSAYHSDFSDIQTNTAVIENGGFIFITSNAAKARIWGAEVETQVQVFESLELGANFSWLDFRYTKIGANANAASILRSVKDNRPKFKYGLNAKYRLPLDENLGQISVSGDWSWQSRDTVGGDTVPADDSLIRYPRGLLSLGASWENVAALPVDASFFVTNVTNKLYRVGGVPISALLGYSTIAYGEPRMFGFRLKYRFSQE